jgi:hypothetical protein
VTGPKSSINVVHQVVVIILIAVAIRWIVIGVGDITTKRVLPAILAEPRSILAGIVTRNPAKAEPYGVPCWTSLDAALVEQECDAVYVASPVFLHAPQTIASPTFACAVKRRWFTVGESPTRELVRSTR